MTNVTKDQFEWDGERLFHRPTGAKFHLRSEVVNLGRAGEDLEDGSTFFPEEVLKVASELVWERKSREASGSSGSSG